MQPRFISPSLCPVFALAIPPLHGLTLHFSRAGARGCWVSPTRRFLGGWSGMTTESLHPGLLDLQSKPRLWESTRWEEGLAGHMATCYSSTCILTGSQAMSQQSQTPLCPGLTLATPPPHPQLTPGDPCSHLLQGSGTCWLARGGGGGEWGEGRNWGSWIGDGRLRSF